MEANQHELYENARSRVKQKKLLYFHLIVLILGSIFLFVANKWFLFYADKDWWIWTVTIWIFIFIFHTIKVFIIDKFLNKDWERMQIDKLMSLQTKKIEELKSDISNAKPSEE